MTTQRRSPFARTVRRGVPLVIAALIVVAGMTALIWPRVFVSIKPGEAGVIYRLFSGIDTRLVMIPGLHVVAPWNTVYRYETRKRTAQHDFDVLSVRGLKVTLALAIRYRPEIDQLGLLHERIGPNYLRRVALPQVESALRRELGQRTAEEIYTNADGLLTRALLLAQDEVARNYVDADEIVIRSVTLPDRVREAIEDKIVQRQTLQSYKFQLKTSVEEAERLRREAQGVRDYNMTIDAALTERMIRYRGLDAARALATSPNTRLVLIGGQNGMPIEAGAVRGLDAIPRAGTEEETAEPNGPVVENRATVPSP